MIIHVMSNFYLSLLVEQKQVLLFEFLMAPVSKEREHAREILLSLQFFLRLATEANGLKAHNSGITVEIVMRRVQKRLN
jgi:hypothetical protein